ncbi:WXG100 family type VII secretion target [Demequina subtropica]|uniref:WXG100 family type VII secretion target n=1 Tax=Demequina subtropica TaxID=1638989 RepID=UPI0007817301|nr:WXG100 family type VII secretion target [Demequina subtropica]
MSRHTVDTQDLRALSQTLHELADHLAMVEGATKRHSHALLATWSGEASREFIEVLDEWASYVGALQAWTTALTERVSKSATNYEWAIAQAEEVTG